MKRRAICKLPPATADPRVHRHRHVPRRSRGGAAAASATLALACLILLDAPGPADGFFRPTTRVMPPPQGPNAISSVPKHRPMRSVLPKHGPRSLPWFGMGEREEAGSGQLRGSSEGATSEDGEEGEEGGSSGVKVGGDDDDITTLPTIEVPEMMSDEDRVRLWMAVSRAESEAVRLDRQGEVEEAAKLRKHADAMRYEDPYTALQDELDEAIKNEEFVKMARLRLQMGRIGVPPNAEMQARAAGRDPSSATAEAAKQMPGMTSRESEGASRSGRGADGSTVSDGYSSKSVTTTHGIRVEVRSQYYPEQSNPLKDQYIFVYKVKITNQSPQTVQLVSRTWEIKAIEATEAPQVVKGPGVVGQQPVLEPGQSFEYSSACPITCPPKEGYQVLGRMKGSYLIVMGAVGEAAFEAKIDPFYLILPQAVLDERAGGSGGGDMAGNNW